MTCGDFDVQTLSTVEIMVSHSSESGSWSMIIKCYVRIRARIIKAKNKQWDPDGGLDPLQYFLPPSREQIVKYFIYTYFLT